MPVRGCWPNSTTWRMWERCASATSSSFASSTTIHIFGARSRSLPPVACNPACARPAWPSCPSAAATDTTSHTVHGHQYSPPGLARLSAHGLHTEKVLRKGAMQGNREAQIMLALMYYHGCHSSRCPLTLTLGLCLCICICSLLGSTVFVIQVSCHVCGTRRYTCPCHPLDLPANAISCPLAI